jgi:hypothetical protein
MRNASAAQVVNEGIEVTIMKPGDRLVGHRFERHIGAALEEHVFDAFDHRDSFVAAAVLTGGCQRSLGQQCDRRESRKHAKHGALREGWQRGNNGARQFNDYLIGSCSHTDLPP